MNSKDELVPATMNVNEPLPVRPAAMPGKTKFI
jgi:hypothetical protein